MHAFVAFTNEGKSQTLRCLGCGEECDYHLAKRVEMPDTKPKQKALF